MMAIVHIDDAIAATVAALTAEPGVYNIVDDDPLQVAEWLRLSPGGSMRRNRPA
jgi:nucleoside-diphosphate-sugar epimerase